MARKRRTWIGPLLFVLVVAQIGVMIEASGHMRNPFRIFTELSTLRLDFSDTGGRIINSQERQPRIQAPGITFVDNTFGEVRWSEFRSVLFDWWFIAAITAVIILIGRPIGLLFKRLRGILKHPRQPRHSTVQREETA
jgi:hypothetical protein